MAGALSTLPGGTDLAEHAPVGKVAFTSEKIYRQLSAAGIEVLWDDRDARPGVKFADMELIRLPHRIVIGDRGLDRGIVEYRRRTETSSQEIEVDVITAYIEKQLQRL